MKTFDTPILFIVFNRPERASKVFESIRKIKPKKLFVSADAPRNNVKADVKLCQETRDILKRIDWDCKVYKKYNSKNLGCRMGVVSAIDWFFNNVEEGIILEDDCLPNESFFRFTEDMLTRYRQDERVLQICGTNAMGRWKEEDQSYFFSYYGSIWGWATWRRAWALNDIDMKLWKNPLVKNGIKAIIPDPFQYLYRKYIYDISFEGKVDAWSYAWSFARLINSGLSIVPAVNLVKNLGFGKESSNTKSRINAFSKLESVNMEFPLKDPEFVIADGLFDWKYFLKLAVYSKFYSLINLPLILAERIFKKVS